MSNSNSTVELQASPWTAAELLAELVEGILRCLPIDQRLSNHALVCKAWATAAAKVTDCINLIVQSDAGSFDTLQFWVNQHAEQLTSLPLSQRPCRSLLSLQLPCADLRQLQTLELNNIVIKLPPAPDAVAGPAAAASTSSAGRAQVARIEAHHPLLPALQLLDLRRCEVDTVADMLQLAQSTALTGLQRDLRFAHEFATSLFPQGGFSDRLNTGVSAMLQRLPGLHTLQLNLGFEAIDPEAVRSITAMGSLQDFSASFDLQPRSSNPSEATLALPHGLTRLVLGTNSAWPVSSRAVFPECLASLQDTLQLQELNLRCCRFAPAVLSKLTRLQKLCLTSCWHLPTLPPAVGSVATAPVRELLGSIAKLMQLQDLSLQVQDFNMQTDLQLFAALTASSQLTSLSLMSDELQVLPRGAARHMFPLGRHMPQLRALRTVWDDQDSTADGWCLNAEDLEQIIAACPQLESLIFISVMEPGESLDALQQLPHSVVDLAVGGKAFGDAAAAANIAKLHNLTKLGWHQSPELSDVGLQRLTALTGLTQLFIMNCSGLSKHISKDCVGKGQLNLHPSHEEGPVWQQLQELCDHSPACAMAAVKELRAENAWLRHRNSILEQRLAEHGVCSDSDLSDSDGGSSVV